MDIAFSGITPSGVIHIGNYLGAIRSWLELQDRFQCFFSVADLHALTTPWQAKSLAQATVDTVRALLAAGLDPQKSTLFVQSQVPFHTELHWILCTLVGVPQLERMTQYKNKARTGRGNERLGLLAYPVLMAADILLYRANSVPVGEDQRQHLELVRTVADRFNRAFGETFPVPEPFFPTIGARIMSLDDPTRKMSKSGRPDSYIALSEDPDSLKEKLKKAVTDPGREVRFAEDKPAISNLLTLYSLISDKNVPELEDIYQGKGYLAFKNDLTDALVEFLRPFRTTLSTIDDDRVMTVVGDGKSHAETVARQTMAEVRARIGLIGT
jgi:tryptophanyl-tRNA synthetase